MNFIHQIKKEKIYVDTRFVTDCENQKKKENKEKRLKMVHANSLLVEFSGPFKVKCHYSY